MHLHHMVVSMTRCVEYCSLYTLQYSDEGCISCFCSSGLGGIGTTGLHIPLKDTNVLENWSFVFSMKRIRQEEAKQETIVASLFYDELFRNEMQSFQTNGIFWLLLDGPSIWQHHMLSLDSACWSRHRMFWSSIPS